LLLSVKLFLLFSITACTPEKHQNQQFLNEIDSLQKQVLADSLAFQELLQMPHDSTMMQMKTLLVQTSPEDPFFESRSLRLESGLLFFGQLKTESGPFLEEISYTAQQLNNLRYDVDQRVLDSLDIKQYLNSEAEAVKRINAKNQYFLNSLNANLLLIETLENSFQTKKD